MLKRFLLTILMLSSLQAIAADNNQSTLEGNRILLYVDDMPVTESLYRSFFASKGYTMPKDGKQQKALQTRVVNELVNTLLMGQEAQKRQLQLQPQTIEAIEIARNEVLSKALIEEFLKEIQISEKQLQNAYMDINAEARRRAEYQLRHILIDSQQQAENLLKQIQTAEDFKRLAKQYSKDASAANEGALGWVTREVLEKEVADALQTLQAGQLPDQAIKSKFGWHLLYIDEIKQQAVPPLEEIKPRLKELITQREIVKKVEALRKNARITKTEDQLKKLPAVE